MGSNIMTMSNIMGLQIGNRLNQNAKAKSASAAKISSGEKLPSAKDGASEYAISEKMRVMIRTLDQNSENVQNGMSLLRSASSGVQQQTDLLATIKEKVLAANNGTVTQKDREIIQKEVSHYYDQIEDISLSTTYNGLNVLYGGTVDEKVVDWAVVNPAKLLEGSDAMKIVPDTYATLDGKPGPFDIFSEVGTTPSAMDSLGMSTGSYLSFSGATDGTPATMKMKLSGGAAAMDGEGFAISSYGAATMYYVLTTSPSSNYKGPSGQAVTKIDISGCTTADDVATVIKGMTFPYQAVGAGASTDEVVFTSSEKSAQANSGTITPWNAPADTVVVTPRPVIPATGLFSGSVYLTGGTYSSGISGDPDFPFVPGTKATLTQDISSVTPGQGFVFHGTYGSVNIELTTGNTASYDSANDVYKVGQNFNGTLPVPGDHISFQNGVMTLEAQYEGDNSRYVTDGVPAIPASTTNYSAVRNSLATVTAAAGGGDGSNAYCTINLSGYNSTNSTDLETFIKDLQGKTLIDNNASTGYEFVDRKEADSFGAMLKGTSSSPVDLNAMRTSVQGGSTIASAFVSLLQNALGASRVAPDPPSGAVTGVKIASLQKGSAANNEKLSAQKSTMRAYTVNFSTWLSSPSVQSQLGAGSLSSFLDGKGFRAYCATCTSQWFNFAFTKDKDQFDDRPKSGNAADDIKTLYIDVTNVTDASSLAKAFYDQVEPVLTGPDKDYNHYMRVAADVADGSITLYDTRKRDVSYYPNHQSHGAKIADGLMDNIVRADRNLLVDRLQIQHTDKSDNNITLKIPRTSLDHIFNYNTEFHSITEYSVLTQANRDKLLGTPPPNEVTGKLDKGLQYLTASNAMLGAQINHLEAAQNNITTQHENITEAESRLRDVNIAGEMVNLVKNNILEQASQSFLAQANSQAGNVMNLLKG